MWRRIVVTSRHGDYYSDIDGLGFTPWMGGA